MTKAHILIDIYGPNGGDRRVDDRIYYETPAVMGEQIHRILKVHNPEGHMVHLKIEIPRKTGSQLQ